MDWKRYYRKELATPAIQREIDDRLSVEKGDDSIDALIAQGSIMSFPHTSAAHAVPLQARVIAALYRLRVKRVIALGVLHTSALPAPYDNYHRMVMDTGRSNNERQRAWASLRGAFVPDLLKVETAFGKLPLHPFDADGTNLVRVDKVGIMEHEFSLDTFFSLLVRYAQLHAMPPIPVTAVYVGMTREPVSGSFTDATELADLLCTLRAPDTAIVTTGDIVHYGTAYTPVEKMEGRSTDARELEAFFKSQCEEALALALTDQNFDGAFTRSIEVLRNDQRYILPVVTAYLGVDAGFRILSFSLSDYATILSVSPPCFVASALVAFIPR